MKITVPAYAKINLFLDVIARRPDGYHEINGVMQAISLGDILTLEITEPGKTTCLTEESLSLSCSQLTIPTDRGNLAWRAAEAFRLSTGKSWEHLHIHIDKHIPVAAGMAGGSTDAAAVLVGLNQCFGHPLTPQALCEVGLTLGADLPFCLQGGAQITRGVGERLTPIASMPPCELVVACGGEGVSTPTAYRTLDELYQDFDPKVYIPRVHELEALTTALHRGELGALCTSLFNLFESAVLPKRPVARFIKETLLSGGALAAMMSGSGPSVFGVFPEGDGRAETVRRQLEARGIPAWVCKPIGGRLGEE